MAGEFLDLVRDDRKSSACLAGAGGLDGGVEREEVGLRCNAGNGIDDIFNALRAGREIGDIFARRFGLLGYETATLEQVGKEIGLTRERVRQIQVEGLRRLREIMTQQGLNMETLFAVEEY